MAAKALPATPQAAGVKTPGTGAYSDPAKVGAMIQQMYPQYASFDPTTLGQRWIDVHTPQAGSGTGTAGSDVLQAPTGTTPMTTTDPNANVNTNVPDLSGLANFAKPVQQQSQQPQSPQNNAPLVGAGGMGGGASLAAPKLPPTPAPQKPFVYTPLPQGLKFNL